MNRKSLFVIFVIVATELVGFGLIIPILPQIAVTFGIQGFALGCLMASYSLAQFIAAPILGGLSDRYGRKSLLIVSQIGTVLSYILLAVSRNFPLFLLARTLDGATGGNISIARAYITDVTDTAHRPSGMAVIGIAFGIGFVLGPALGGLLHGIGPAHTVPALAAGVLSCLALIMTVVFLKEPSVHVSSEARRLTWASFTAILKNKKVQLILFIQIIFITAFSGFEATLSIFTHTIFNFTKQQNSLMFMYIGGVIFIAQGVIARKSSTRVYKMSLLGLYLTAIGLWAVGLSVNVATLMIALAVNSFGVGMAFAYIPSLLSLANREQDEGKMMGLYEGWGSISRVIGPIIASVIIFTLPRGSYMILGMVLAWAAFLFSMLYNRLGKSSGQE